MGRYVNPGSGKFQMGLNSEIYVDKSGLIEKTNALFQTKQRFICLSRPRRFGKTMAAEMLAAYYGVGEDASSLFDSLKIAEYPSYEKYLNKYNVLMINMQEFLSQSKSVDAMIEMLESKVMKELKNLYSEFDYDEVDGFIDVMQYVYQESKRPFVILIDEWDCLFREYKDDKESQKKYLDFLRLWLKDQEYVGLAYMTGILPIKKYGSHSALNMFREYSMTEPSQFLEYFGFTESEVEVLVNRYGADFNEMRRWYNGYFVDLGTSIYNPTSVSECLSRQNFSSYWNRTETYEALRDYIMLNYDGLKDKITQMLAGNSVVIETETFINDMTTFNSADDVLTLLVHLGYLTYNFKKKTVCIPNEEIKSEFVASIKVLKWSNVVDAINESQKLLQAVWDLEFDVVAEGIQKVHEQNTSILQYNDENSLSCVISLALYGANEYYTLKSVRDLLNCDKLNDVGTFDISSSKCIPRVKTSSSWSLQLDSVVREMPSGKGYADLVFIPRSGHLDKPALVVELKWDKDALGAISQIKERNYISALDDYRDNLILVGVSYDKKSKSHECVIEKLM